MDAWENTTWAKRFSESWFKKGVCVGVDSEALKVATSMDLKLSRSETVVSLCALELETSMFLSQRIEWKRLGGERMCSS